MRLTLISFSILFSLIGCSRKQDGLSKISIQTPASLHGKVGALATLPAGRVACYGVSIRGSGIDGVGSNSCHPELGAVFGFVAANGALEGEVQKGSGRIFDVYLYLQPTGQNNPCPSMATSFTGLNPSELYLIGTLPNVNLEKDTETVNITTTFPGVASNMYTVNSYPSSCLPAPSKNGFQISAGIVMGVGTGYKLQGRIGRAMNGPELTGTGYKLRLKE